MSEYRSPRIAFEREPDLHILGAQSTWALGKCAFYRGPLDDKRPEEVALLLSEALEYFGISGSESPPVPFDGLFGVRHLRDAEPTLSLWRAALAVLKGMANGKPRSMIAAWDELETIVFKERRTAVEERVRHAVSEIQRDADKRQREETKRLVYFVGGADGPVKIGVATNPAIRLKELQTSHHQPLRVMATVRGGQAQEAAYHRRFAAHRLAGEWFTRVPEIEAEIARLSAPARGCAERGL